MDEQSDDIIIWKTSRRGMGERHLLEGYPAEEFPADPVNRFDGCAYFARDRWIAEEFAATNLAGYEDFVVEVAIPRAIYERYFQQYERPLLGSRCGIQLVIPAQQLELLNKVGARRIASDITSQDSN